MLKAIKPRQKSNEGTKVINHQLKAGVWKPEDLLGGTNSRSSSATQQKLNTRPGV